MREVHDYVADVIRRSQEAGGIFPDREASAEAWIFLAIGLLGTVGRRVGGLIHDDFPDDHHAAPPLDDRHRRAAGHLGHARHLRGQTGAGLPKRESPRLRPRGLIP